MFTREDTSCLGRLGEELHTSRSEAEIEEVVLTENEVYEELHRIDPTNASGSDEIPGSRADRCIPPCNHLTLFGSAASVVEFPPQIPVLDASEVSRQERLFHCFKTQLLFCSGSFESTA